MFGIIEDQEGNLWIATMGGGLNLFNNKTKTFKRGIHNIIIRAIDEAGNMDEEVVKFTVDY